MKLRLLHYSRAASILLGTFLISFRVPVAAQCPVHPGFTYSQDCEYFQFTDTSVLISGTILGYKWDFGDGDVSFTQNPSHTFDPENAYTVTHWVYHDSGCDTSVAKIVSVFKPTANFTLILSCVNEPIQFTDLSLPNSGTLVSWLWDFGDGGNSTLQNPTHTYPAAGVYNIDLTVTNSLGCTDTKSMDIQVFPSPLADFSYSNSCGNTVTSFTDLSQGFGVNIIEWLWNFGSGNTSTLQNPTFAFPGPGIFNVSLTVKNALSCVGDTVIPVQVDSVPEAAFTGDVGCVGKQTCFYDQSIPHAPGNSTFEWMIDGLFGYFSQNICHIFSDPGDHWVRLIITNSNNCSDTLTQTITVAFPPVANFTATEACFGDTTEFTNNTQLQGVPIDTWYWNFDDPGSGSANTSDLENPTHLFFTEGFFEVLLVATNQSGCVDSVVNYVVVDSLPEAAFSAANSSVGTPVTFTDLSVPHGSPIINRFWDFGDGMTATNPNPVVHTYTAEGTFLVTLTITDANGCEDVVQHEITITKRPIADFVYQLQPALLVQFTDSSKTFGTSIDSWLWNFGDTASGTSNTSILKNPDHSFTTLGDYYVTLTITDNNGGSDDTTMLITVGYAIMASFWAENNCHGSPVLFHDESQPNSFSTIDQWKWTFGDGKDTTYTSGTGLLSHYYEDPGTYLVTLIVQATLQGATLLDTATQYVMTYPTPDAAFQGSNLCLGDTAHFIDKSVPNGSPITAWNWNFGDGSTSSLPNPTHIYYNLGAYSVQLKVENAQGCSDVITQTVHVSTVPVFDFSFTPACVNSPTFFTLLTDSVQVITSTIWDFGDPNDTTGAYTPEAVHYYSSVGLITATLTVADYGCKSEVSHEFLVFPIPYSDFSITENYEGVTGRTLFNNESIYATEYEWDFGNGNTSTEIDPVEIYEIDSTYLVMMVAINEYGCMDTSWQEIKIFFKGLYIPTAFSPNNPNREVSLFTPKGINIQEYEMLVYTLEGDLVWESEALDENGSPTESWDGYYEGVLLPAGTYIWKARAVFRDGTQWKGSTFQGPDPQTHGTITLIR